MTGMGIPISHNNIPRMISSMVKLQKDLKESHIKKTGEEIREELRLQ